MLRKFNLFNGHKLLESVPYKTISELLLDEGRKRAQITIDEENELQVAEDELSAFLEEVSERRFFMVPATNSLVNLEKHEANIRELIINRMRTVFADIKHPLSSCVAHNAGGQSTFLREQQLASDSEDGEVDDQLRVELQVGEMRILDNELFDILGDMKTIYMADVADCRTEVAQLKSQLTEARSVKPLPGKSDAATHTDLFFDDRFSHSESRSRSLSNRTVASNLSGYKIFAYRSDKTLNQTTSLVTMNVPEIELTFEDLKQMRETSLLVKSPAGHLYRFSEGRDGQEPRAEMTEAQAKPDPNDSLDQSNLRLAQTIINMIDNVLSRSDVIDVNTSNPFVAAIAREYISHIKNKKENVIISDKIICSTSCPTADDHAKKIFNDIKLVNVNNNPALSYRPVFEQLKLNEEKYIVDENLRFSEPLLEETSRYVEMETSSRTTPYRRLPLRSLEEESIVDERFSLNRN